MYEYLCWCRLLRWARLNLFLGMFNLNVSIMQHAKEVGYVHSVGKTSLSKISSNHDVVDI